ncbi:glycosyltransferase family 4 protein [Frondihabitans sucicola]|uniref:glycosyltransferase family 4 protein n=1 Tax=Frondihabitans sucicola TaxID=1268041 RepID=UPI002572E4E4|nr:glycosyltransferase family 4 protein [Frondihabitans sucicola]
MSDSGELVVRFVVPGFVDDDERVSGGNVYDRRLRDGLRGLGLEVVLLPLPVSGATELPGALSLLPDDALVLVDGLLAVAVAAAEALTAESSRLRLVLLAHMVASRLIEGDEGGQSAVARERAVLAAAWRIIATSRWTRSELITLGADPERVVVAPPGTDSADASTGSESGAARLLCVGAIAPHKGQDVVVEALAELASVPGWTCEFVGSLTAEPAFAARLEAEVTARGMADRISFTGVAVGATLDAAFAEADLVIAASRVESYGMAVAEALARAIPVLTTDAGGSRRRSRTRPPESPYRRATARRSPTPSGAG